MSCRTIPLEGLCWAWQCRPRVGVPLRRASPPINADGRLALWLTPSGCCSHRQAPCRSTGDPCGLLLVQRLWRKISTVWWMFSLQERSCLAAIIARLTGSGKNSCFQAVLYWPWSTFSNSEKEWVQLRFICMASLLNSGIVLVSCWRWTWLRVCHCPGGLQLSLCCASHWSATCRSLGETFSHPRSPIEENGASFCKLRPWLMSKDVR